MGFSLGQFDVRREGTSRDWEAPPESAGAEFSLPALRRGAGAARSLYVAPANLDGKMHSLDVRVASPGATVRARKSYLAEPDK